MSDYDLQTYTNREVIEIDQDPLGIQGQVVWTNCPTPPHLTKLVEESPPPLTKLVEDSPPPLTKLARRRAAAGGSVPDCQQIWWRPLAGGDTALVFLNYGAGAADVTCDDVCFTRMGYRNGERPTTVRDVWASLESPRRASSERPGHASPPATDLKVSLVASGGCRLFRLSGRAFV